MHHVRAACLTFAIATAFALAPMSSRAADAQANDQKQVPLKYEIPKAMFLGTPKNIKARRNSGALLGKGPRAVDDSRRLHEPRGEEESHVQRLQSNHWRVVADHRRRQGRRRRQLCRTRTGKQWVQIDLEQPADLSAVVVWHYHAEGRVYHSVVVQISDDPEFEKDVKTVFNNDFANAPGFGAGRTWSTSTIIAARQLP